MENNKNPPFPIWAMALFLAIIGSLMLWVKTLPQLDLIYWLQRDRNDFITVSLQLISDSVSIFSLGIPVALAVIAEFKSADKKNSRSSFLFVVLSIAMAGLVSYMIKNIGSVPRPYAVDARLIKLSVGGSFSFPSGHTTEAFAAFSSLVFLFPKWKIALPLFLWASLVAFSRIYLGVHYPFDILGGITIGITTAYSMHFVFDKRTTIFHRAPSAP